MVAVRGLVVVDSVYVYGIEVYCGGVRGARKPEVGLRERSAERTMEALVKIEMKEGMSRDMCGRARSLSVKLLCC